MDRRDGAFQDVRVEPRVQALRSGLEVRDPRLDDGVVAQVRPSRPLIGEGGGPGGEVPPQGLRLLGVVTAGDVPFKHHQGSTATRIWSRR